MWWVQVIAAGVLLLAALAWFVPPTDIEAHNILHHLNFIPLMAAGMVFGWQGALWALLFSGLIHAPHLLAIWPNAKADVFDQAIELGIFGVAGLIAGLLSDRERAQKVRLEQTTVQLEQVYKELQTNIEQVKKSERLSAAGQLAASLAHEIRNPLASISGAAGIIGRGHASNQNLNECLEIIQKESDRLNKLLGSFLDFARPRPPRFQPTDLRVLIQSVIVQSAHLNGVSSTPVRPIVNQSLPEVECDPEQIRQVLINLLLNAIQASPEQESVEVEARQQGQRVAVMIKDKGRGISKGDQAHIFEPFFTTKQGGTGLGLAIASKIIEQHEGALLAEETPGGGTTFRFDLRIKRATE
jgi:two-component system sensor histidine kinase HydH